MGVLRENWRVVLLTVIVLAAGAALFVPGLPPGTSAEETGLSGENASLTNLQYGIQLDGGTRLQAPVVGITAEGINAGGNDTAVLAQNVSDRLSVDEIDVRVSSGDGTVEVFSRNVSQGDLQSALEAEGHAPDGIRDGVTQRTREDMVEVIENKLRESALSGGSVGTTQTPGGQNYISITAPDRDREELQSILEERGVVRVYAFYPSDNGTYVRDQVLEQDDLVNIGNARETDRGPRVSVTVREGTAGDFQNAMDERGFGGGATCQYDRENPQESQGQCLLATLNDEVVFDGGVQPDLGSSFADGSFADDPTFEMSTTTLDEARELELSLKAGRLPAPLNFEDARSNSLEPSLAERFKTNSLITGLVAVLAVSVMVYLRYGDVRVAAPMIVTALSEVLILLGFVAFVRYPLNLSHIAGFIAVIGTGVDDLIIIADEILQRGEIATGRVFQSRFRKAFWVIGAAAATTIMAMSPLAVIGLGDLTGFAIVTIVGVLIGVLITRPAYGDILRNLMLDEENE